MVGIVSYGAYIPWYRLGAETKGWTSRTERAVANFNEDSITMGVAASIDCVGGLSRQDIDALYFASTTFPYCEKMNSNIVGVATDLSAGVPTADFGNSLRAATIALRAAVDAVKAGSAKQVLVVASDLRVPQPRSQFEPSFGDGAAALLIGDQKVAVEIEDNCSISQEIHDVWRAEGDRFIRFWEDRFVISEGYYKVFPGVISKLLDKNNVDPKDIHKAVFYAPDHRRHREMARKLGFQPNQVQDPLFGSMGNTGTAFALTLLVAALEEAEPNDRIALANFGNGADAFLLKTTEHITGVKNRRGVTAYLQSKEVLSDYETYTRWRGLIDLAPVSRRPALRTPSPSALLRETDKNLRFYGVKCRRCGYVQYPPQRVCTNCHAKGEFDSYRFSDKRAKVFTYTLDNLGLTSDPPLVIAVIDFEGGGRTIAMMTDRDIERIEIGMPVEMTFRRFYSSEGIHNYCWECMPVR